MHISASGSQSKKHRSRTDIGILKILWFTHEDEVGLSPNLFDFHFQQYISNSATISQTTP